MTQAKRRQPSLMKLRGPRALFGALGLFALCGPIVGSVTSLLATFVFDRSAVRDMADAPVLVLPLVAYVIGALPALATGAIASLCPFDGKLRFLARCAITGFLAGAAEMLAFLLLVEFRQQFHSRTTDQMWLVLPVLLTGGAGAAAGLACGALLRRLFAKAAQPENLAEAFS